MRKTPINPRGKVSKRRFKAQGEINETLCERAGGTWESNGNGRWHCSGHSCEFCGRAGDLQAAHITSRAHQGHETMDNEVVICQSCHDLFDHGTAEVREAMQERAREIAGRE